MREDRRRFGASGRGRRTSRRGCERCGARWKSWIKTYRSQIDARLGGGTLERATRRRCERDAADGQGGTLTSLRRLNAAALNAAEALVRENRLAHHSSNSENHLTYAEALGQSGYKGDNGVVVLSKRMSAARVRGAWMHRWMWRWTRSSI